MADQTTLAGGAACPVCKISHEAIIIEIEDDQCRVHCEECGCCGPWESSPENANMVWDAMPRDGDKAREIATMQKCIPLACNWCENGEYKLVNGGDGYWFHVIENDATSCQCPRLHDEIAKLEAE